MPAHAAPPGTGTGAADVDVVLCDLDGVVWLDHVAIPGAADAVRAMRRSGRRVVFVTNNSSKTLAEQERALGAIGIEATGDIVTSSMAAASLLRAGERALVTGGAGIVEALVASGVETVVNDADMPAAGVDAAFDAVVVGIDRDIDYRRLTVAARALRGGARLIATNDDATFPTPDGITPGAGSIVAAVAVAGGADPVVAGKPNAAMCLAVLAHVGVAPADAARRVLVIGDRTDTDGLFAAALGCTFALVRTGITDPLATLDPASAPLVALDLPAITDVADWLTG